MARSLVTATEQLVPVQLTPLPCQATNDEPAAGVAVSVTDVPAAKDAEQVLPQLMPWGELITVPEPVTLTETVKF
jgi:hypothetical protein